jgi:hypothetical protein
MRVCPQPLAWHEAFERLTQYAEVHPCKPPRPPTPLILGGWVYSNDVEKMERWEQTCEWARTNSCAHLISDMPADAFYYVDEPWAGAIGPLGGPMVRPWDFEAKSRPPEEELRRLLALLSERWAEIVGAQLAATTRPLRFSGAKARRLLVEANGAATPPWGGWSFRSYEERERQAFRDFRTAVNSAIAPHQVDHIDFVPIDPG